MFKAALKCTQEGRRRVPSGEPFRQTAVLCISNTGSVGVGILSLAMLESSPSSVGSQTQSMSTYPGILRDSQPLHYKYAPAVLFPDNGIWKGILWKPSPCFPT